MNSNSEPNEHASNAASGMRRLRLGPLLMGAVLGLVITIVALAIYNRRTLPRLTQTDYDAAVARWQKNGPADYDLDIELSGNRPGKIHLEVRDREVVHMTRDGVEPKQKRTWDYWSIPGQFDTIGQELEMAKDPAGSFHAPGASQVVMWAEFDPKFGYPKEYHRVVLGADFEAHWITRRFETRSAKN